MLGAGLPRPYPPRALAALKHLGIQAMMLTGDARARSRKLFTEALEEAAAKLS
jgi:cation transport ATPase